MATGQSRAVWQHREIVHGADFCRVQARQAGRRGGGASERKELDAGVEGLDGAVRVASFEAGCWITP